MLKLQYFSHLRRRFNSLEKDPDAEKGWRQKEKEVAEHEMVIQHNYLNGHKFQQTPGEGGGRRGLAGCSQLSCKKSDRTQWLSNKDSEAEPETGRCCWSRSQWRGLTVSHVCTAHRPKVSKAWAGKLEQSSGAMDFLFSAACTAAIAADRPRSPLSWLTQHSREAAAALPLSKWSSCRLAAGVPAGSLVMGVHSARRGLSCYIIIIHKMRARARGHGARQPDCATLVHLLSPWRPTPVFCLEKSRAEEPGWLQSAGCPKSQSSLSDWVTSTLAKQSRLSRNVS